MIITKEWLKERGAGEWPWEELTDWFLNQREDDGVAIIKALIAEKKFNEAVWFTIQQMNYVQYLSYAVFSIEQALDIYKGKYHNDRNLSKTMDAVKKCINNPTRSNKAAAQAAGRDYLYINGNVADKVESSLSDIVTAAVYSIAPATGVAVLKVCKTVGKDISAMIFNYGIELLEIKGEIS